MNGLLWVYNNISARDKRLPLADTVRDERETRPCPGKTRSNEQATHQLVRISILTDLNLVLGGTRRVKALCMLLSSILHVI